MTWQEWLISLILFKTILFTNLSSRVNSIIAHFYGFFVHAYQTNNLINKIHKRALSLTSEKNDITLNELLSINNEVSIHNKNLQTLLIEVYKNLNGLSTTRKLDLFTAR